MGRSRGGLTTKIHALVDADGLPIALTLSEGQAHDGRSAAPMLGARGPGQTLIADRAYDSDVLRQTMTAQGAWANVKPISRRVNKPAFSPFLSRYRCPSSDNLRQGAGFRSGGSGSSGFEVRRPSRGAASDGWR